MRQEEFEISDSETTTGIADLSGSKSERLGFRPSAHSVSASGASASSPGLGRSAASRDEMNLAEFPLAVLSTRATPGVKTLEFSDTQKLRNGEIFERKWIITGADKFGLPTSTDEDVVLGLICLTMDQGFRDRKVFFTRYELLKVLRWTTEGRSYSRLGRSLDRLSGVRIRATNAFFDNSAKGYQTCNFGIIDAYELNDERSKCAEKGEPAKSFFIWSEVLFDSFKAGFIKKIDLDLYFSLNSAVSRRLYRYLDKHFYYKPTVERPLMMFAFEKLGLARTYKYVSSIKQQIEPAAEELIRRGFLGSVEFIGKGANTVVRFNQQRSGSVHHGVVTATQPASVPANAAAAEDPRRRITGALVTRGILPKQASRLIEGKTPADIERIEKIIVYFDRLVAAKDIRVSKNSIGFLYRAVETPFKFTLPQELNAQPQRRSLRPELRVVSSSKVRPVKTAEPNRAARALYEDFKNREAERLRGALAAEELARFSAAAVDRMNCLRNLLTADRFAAAVETSLKDELCRLNGVPSFDDWAAANLQR